jgi:hypothetical protein
MIAERQASWLSGDAYGEKEGNKSKIKEKTRERERERESEKLPNFYVQRKKYTNKCIKNLNIQYGPSTCQCTASPLTCSFCPSQNPHYL